MATAFAAVEIDLDQVRRQRERGLHGGLGQLLKSFRDRKFALPVYDGAGGATEYLNSLGPLRMPGKPGADS